MDPRVIKSNLNFVKFAKPFVVPEKLSTEPASRHDIETLISDLDVRLGQLKTRKKGFCPARTKLYDAAFSELIRQVTLQSSEQGLLLVRIRNEARMTLKVYQTLYENSTAIAVKKIEAAKVSKMNLEEEIMQLSEEIIELDRELIVEQQKYKMVLRRTSELMEAISRTQENDLGYLGKGIKQMRIIIDILEAVVPKRKDTD